MNKLLTHSEVASLINVKPSTIYKWTSEGFIPHIKIGNSIRFDESDILRWLTKLKRTGRKDRYLGLDL